MNSSYMQQACHWAEDDISELMGGDSWQVTLGVQVGVNGRTHKAECCWHCYLMWVRASREEICCLYGCYSYATLQEKGYKGMKLVINLEKDSDTAEGRVSRASVTVSCSHPYTDRVMLAPNGSYENCMRQRLWKYFVTWKGGCYDRRHYLVFYPLRRAHTMMTAGPPLAGPQGPLLLVLFGEFSLSFKSAPAFLSSPPSSPHSWDSFFP